MTEKEFQNEIIMAFIFKTESNMVMERQKLNVRSKVCVGNQE